MPRCEVGGHLLVCVKASVVVGTAEVAVDLVSTRDGMERLGLHDGINLRCGRRKMVSEKLAFLQFWGGKVEEFMGVGGPIRGKDLTCKKEVGNRRGLGGHGPRGVEPYVYLPNRK